METIKLPEELLINAVCLYIAEKKQISPNDVTVELMWDDEVGFSAEVFALDRQQILVESNLIEAVRFLLQTQLNRDPYAAAIELVLDDEEGILALANYRS